MPDTRARLQWVTASIAKAGNPPEENEDAAAAGSTGLRFAVADGATEGWESGPWATHLAQYYVRTPPGPDNFTEWLSDVREKWKPPTATSPTAWYAVEKQEQGSFATLVGLELRRMATDGEWAYKAVAVGDSCLVQIRAGRIEASFPIAAASGFDNRPPLVPSSVEVECPEPEWLAGRAVAGDLLVLATDAAAADLLRLADGTGAEEFVAAAHDRDRLRDWCRKVQMTANDDATVTAIRIPTPPEPS